MAELVSYTVLFTGLAAGARDVRAMLAADATAKVTSIDLDECQRNGDAEPMGDVIVVGPRVTRPYDAAEHLRQISPCAQVVFLVEAQKLEKFRAALLFVPQLSDAWTAAVADPLARIIAVIFEAARAARHRDALARVRNRINEQIALRHSNGELERRRRHILLSERYMATVLKQAPDPIFALDIAGHILSSNDAASEAFALRSSKGGYPKALDLFHADERTEAAVRLRETGAGATCLKWVTLMTGREGAALECSVSLAPVRDAAGAITGIAMVARDITDYQQIQRRLRDRTEVLEATIAQRDMLLREVYHRVKNNLQVVDALIHVETRRIDDPRVKGWLADLRQRVNTIGLVHQRLMASDDLETIDLAEFLEELAEKIAASPPDPASIKLISGQASVKLPLDVAVPLGLIVTELLTNALKHGRPPKGAAQRITLTLSREKTRAAVTVRDNGCSAEGYKKLLAGAGSGGKIVNGLVRQIDGELRAGFLGGTEVVAEFPIGRKA